MKRTNLIWIFALFFIVLPFSFAEECTIKDNYTSLNVKPCHAYTTNGTYDYIFTLCNLYSKSVVISTNNIFNENVTSALYKIENGQETLLDSFSQKQKIVSYSGTSLDAGLCADYRFSFRPDASQGKYDVNILSYDKGFLVSNLTLDPFYDYSTNNTEWTFTKGTYGTSTWTQQSAEAWANDTGVQTGYLKVHGFDAGGVDGWGRVNRTDQIVGDFSLNFSSEQMSRVMQSNTYCRAEVLMMNMTRNKMHTAFIYFNYQAPAGFPTNTTENTTIMDYSVMYDNNQPPTATYRRLNLVMNNFLSNVSQHNANFNKTYVQENLQYVDFAVLCYSDFGEVMTRLDNFTIESRPSISAPVVSLPNGSVQYDNENVTALWTSGGMEVNTTAWVETNVSFIAYLFQLQNYKNFTFNSSSFPNGTYRIGVTDFDELGFNATGYSAYFNITNTPPYVPPEKTTADSIDSFTSNFIFLMLILTTIIAYAISLFKLPDLGSMMLKFLALATCLSSALFLPVPNLSYMVIVFSVLILVHSIAQMILLIDEFI